MNRREAHDSKRFGGHGWLERPVADLKRKGFNQFGLLAVVQAELTGFLIDQLKLPGH